MSLESAATQLRAAKQPLIVSGAGISKESGVPTFRDTQDGLWAKYDPMELATPEAFARNPKLVWDWYAYRRALVSEAKPNAGHLAIAALAAHFGALPVVTQNVDDLHEQAGSGDVIHLHGSIAQTRCSVDCQGHPTILDTLTDDDPPRCPHCGACARPNVVWFGESLPAEAMQRAQTLCAVADVVLVVGTSGLVTPAALLPHYAREAGATLIEVNPQPSALTEIMDVHLEGPGGEILPKLSAIVAG